MHCAFFQLDNKGLTLLVGPCWGIPELFSQQCAGLTPTKTPPLIDMLDFFEIRSTDGSFGFAGSGCPRAELIHDSIVDHSLIIGSRKAKFLKLDISIESTRWHRLLHSRRGKREISQVKSLKHFPVVGCCISTAQLCMLLCNLPKSVMQHYNQREVDSEFQFCPSYRNPWSNFLDKDALSKEDKEWIRPFLEAKSS